jgi:hypothetical protein
MAKRTPSGSVAKRIVALTPIVEIEELQVEVPKQRRKWLNG